MEEEKERVIRKEFMNELKKKKRRQLKIILT